jgi:hypothetical protein
MATTAIAPPIIGADSALANGGAPDFSHLGQAAQERLRQRERRITELELRGEIKPATILNRSPFPLKVETGLWDYVVSAREFPEKPFSALTVTGTRSLPIYRGNQEMSDKSLRSKYDVKILLPVEQLMEFKHWYVGETQEDRLVKSGGVVVFEGSMQDIKPASIVRVPEYVFKKGERYLRFVDRQLKEMLDEADEQLYNHCHAVLMEANHDADDPQKRKNIQRYQHTVADFMLQMKQIQNAPAWRNVQFKSEDCCPRCNAQYVSKTGVCKCSFVVDPFLAYMESEIAIDHVRMGKLTPAQWKKVNEEEARRKKAQGAE